MNTLLISFLICSAVWAGFIFLNSRADRAPQEESAPDYGSAIADTFRTLARQLKRAGEYPLCADALFLAKKAEGGEVSLYTAAYALNLIAEETTQTDAVREAAATLYALNEGAGE